MVDWKGFARQSEDDRVTFSSGITIYAPFGRGHEVLEAIMRASATDAAK